MKSKSYGLHCTLGIHCIHFKIEKYLSTTAGSHALVLLRFKIRRAFVLITNVLNNFYLIIIIDLSGCCN